MLHHLRILHARPRLILCMLSGLLVGLSLPSSWPDLLRSMIGWNVFAWSYCAALVVLMMRAHHNRIRHLARVQDESARTVLFLVCGGCIASVAAIALQLGQARQLDAWSQIGNLALTGSTLLVSWVLLPIAFALHYGHLFYLCPPDRPCLLFPDPHNVPDYWDFMYFSFTIAAGSQTSDISIASPAMRRLVLLQTVLSFFFNMAILGLSINVAAGLLNG